MLPRVKFSFCRQSLRWLVPTALLALAPKCAICVLTYFGLGAALGIGGPELCGATDRASPGWIIMMALLAGLTGIGITRWLFLRRRSLDEEAA